MDSDEQLPALDERSDAWLVSRARELLAVSQNCEPVDRLRHAESVDRLLAEAQHRGEPRMIGQLLRYAVAVRVVDSELAGTVGPLLDELLEHTRRHGLTLLEADAHALRGRNFLHANQEDSALSAVAVALAMLDEDIAQDANMDRRAWDTLMAATLLDIATVLTNLGIYKIADSVLRRANKHTRSSAGPHLITVHMLNRLHLLLAWGLRLERAGRDAEAARHFGTAAALAIDIETPFRQSLFPRNAELPAAEQHPIVAAARALAEPNGGHVARLRQLTDKVRFASELITVAIALARCLEQDQQVDQAIAVLDQAREAQGALATEPETALRLCLLREHARLCGPAKGSAAAASLATYATQLEHHLWELGESRVATLNTRREHERLSRRHGTISAQALQDPLTGLPNRRALDERLEELAAVSNRPLAIALVDLDGFKGVNDRLSHAEGDDVLRVVASTLRDALRGSDMVARYGGDEFIVLLPGAPLLPAEAALRRAVNAVATLPHNLSHGVTLSIGVVSLRHKESTASALARADAAMYQAKRRGGNDIVAAPSELTVVPPDPAWVLPEAT